jgi:hypothetical protein
MTSMYVDAFGGTGATGCAHEATTTPRTIALARTARADREQTTRIIPNVSISVGDGKSPSIRAIESRRRVGCAACKWSYVIMTTQRILGPNSQRGAPFQRERNCGRHSLIGAFRHLLSRALRGRAGLEILIPVNVDGGKEEARGIAHREGEADRVHDGDVLALGELHDDEPVPIAPAEPVERPLRQLKA